MKALLVLLIIFFCLIIGRLNKKKFKFSLLLSIAFIFTPVVLFHKINKEILVIFCISLLLFVFYEFFKNKIIKKFFFVLIIIFYFYSILNLTGILDIKMNIDIQKLFFVNNSSVNIIKRFRHDALYLPVFLRPLVFNYFQLVFVAITRIINYLWIDKLIGFFGFSFLYLIYLSFFNKKNIIFLFFPILITMFFVLHRDPNTNLMYLFLLPSLVLIFIKNIKKLNPNLLLTLVFFSFLYSFL